MSDYNHYELPSGTLLHNRYRIHSVIGQGGFGITYKATDQTNNQSVCIKELYIAGHCTRGAGHTVQVQGLESEVFADYIKRFIAEAKSLQAFKHPGIVHVNDVFEALNTAFYVMDFVDGPTLKQKVSQLGRLKYQEAAEIFSKLMLAVDEVHRHNLLHRDIKPDNIIIDPNGQPILLDFGSARALGDGRTTTQTAILTPGYAPLEQYSERARRGPFTDVYGLGATFYFCLTGKKPLPVTDRQMETLQAPHQLHADIPESLSSAVMLAMSIKPEDRFQTVAEFRDALGNMLHNWAGDSVQKEYKPDNSQTESVNKSKPSTKSGRRLAISAMAIGVSLLLALGAYKLIEHNRPYPFEVSKSEEVIRNFYACYDYSANKQDRAKCVSDYFSPSYQNSYDAKAIIDAYYAYKEHTLNSVEVKEEDGNRRILSVSYNFTFRQRRTNRLEKQTDGLMEITLDAEHRIDLIRFMRLPESQR
ncbi:MAG: serine/threonine protein kinase [Bacteroidota bacterium]|jgi:serine/threonine protein kinase